MTRVWIIKDGESIPLEGSIKRQRAVLLADTLAEAGHDVTYWTSTHHHVKKRLLFTYDHSAIIASGVRVRFLHAGAYTRNISLARIRHHRRFATVLADAFEKESQKPQVIVASYPILEAVHVAVRFGAKYGIPVVVDVRDQWPDTFVNYAPALLKPLVRLLTHLLYPHAAADLRAATAISSMSTPVLEWALTKAARKARAEDTGVFFLSTDLNPDALDAEPEGKTPLLPEYAHAGEALRCTYLGTLSNTADLGTLAEAILLLNARGEGGRFRFIIAGEGDLGEALRAKLADAPNVTFTGWLDKLQCHRLLRQSDIAFLIGKNAAMPNKLFDYVSYGLPMLCSFHGEAPAFVRRHDLGEICPPENPQALSEALLRLRGARLEQVRRAVAALPPALYKQEIIYRDFADFVLKHASQG